MADSRTDAYSALHEAMVEFFKWGGGQGEIHPMVEAAYRDYSVRRAQEVKARQKEAKNESTNSQP